MQLLNIADINDYVPHSGWLSYGGMPCGTNTLHNVLASKCNMTYDQFMNVNKAVYMLSGVMKTSTLVCYWGMGALYISKLCFCFRPNRYT